MNPERLLAAVALPGDDEGPVFAEPWQADALAIVVALTDAAIFTPAEWSQALGSAIREAQRAGDPDRGDTYYRHWVEALVGLCEARGKITTPALDTREDEWREAYEHTPHGQPVELHAKRK